MIQPSDNQIATAIAIAWEIWQRAIDSSGGTEFGPGEQGGEIGKIARAILQQATEPS